MKSYFRIYYHDTEGLENDKILGDKVKVSKMGTLYIYYNNDPVAVYPKHEWVKVVKFKEEENG